MNRCFDRELGLHCAPALAGIKPANLLCCRFSRYPDFDRVIECYNSIFASGEIRFDVLCRCPESCLLLVYRRRTLAQQLQQPEIRTLLETAGYFRGNTVEEDLERLSQRLCRSEGVFPHEIGLFLGYPPEDVTGFVRHRGQNFKFCGHWKVYSNEQKARRIFECYDRCRCAVCNRLAEGMSIPQMFGAA